MPERLVGRNPDLVGHPRPDLGRVGHCRGPTAGSRTRGSLLWTHGRISDAWVTVVDPRPDLGRVGHCRGPTAGSRTRGSLPRIWGNSPFRGSRRHSEAASPSLVV